MSHADEVAVGLCGMGGFAGSIAQSLLAAGTSADPPLRLVAVCDPRWRQLGDQVAQLTGAGVEVCGDVETLLRRAEVRGLWLPLPIDLHRPFTERALAAGKHVMCEKPAAGCIDDVDAMIAARDRSQLSVLIGFQDVYDPATADVKRMLLDGAIGEVSHATLTACWPRSDAYFRRTPWAGRIARDGAWVLDSPANNALSHYIHLALLLLGPTLHDAAAPVEIDAELYRAATIENYDTISARASLSTGPTLLVLLTHACANQTEPVIRIHGSRGAIERTRRQYRLTTPDGERVIPYRFGSRLYPHVVGAWSRAMTGRVRDDELTATLEMAQQHALFVSGASEAAVVHTIHPMNLTMVAGEGGESIAAIPNVDLVFEHCAAHNLMLHESGRFEFTVPSGRFNLRGYRRFTGNRTPAAADCRTSEAV